MFSIDFTINHLLRFLATTQKGNFAKDKLFLQSYRFFYLASGAEFESSIQIWQWDSNI